MEFQVKISLALFAIGLGAFFLAWLVESVKYAKLILESYLFLWSPFWLFAIGDGCYHSQNVVARGLGIIFYLAAAVSFVVLINIVKRRQTTT